MSLTKAEEKQFYSMKPKPQYRITMGGKSVKLVNMPKEIQDKVKKRLAEKDEVMAQGLKGILPGIKIDGKQVTKDNIKDFEIPKMGALGKAKPKKTEVEVKKYTKSELEKLSFSKLKAIAKKLGETGRSAAGLIKDILKH